MITSSFSQHFYGYDILGELGRGNARVLKARQIGTGDCVAIKHFSFNTDPETIRRFQRESEIMTSIKHSNVVKIKEVQLEAVLPYIVMELVEGGDVRTLLKVRNRLEVSDTISLAEQMVEAFSAIHQKGITHRDVKPENIMCRLQPDGHIDFLLTDFGIARLREQPQTLTGGAMMTYEYASPEQFDDPKSVTAATDYYSLGVVLYECITGKVPFPLTDGRVHAFVNQVMKDAPAPISFSVTTYLPPSFIKLIDGLLTKRADDRIADIDEVKVLLQQAKSELAIYTSPALDKIRAVTWAAPYVKDNFRDVAEPPAVWEPVFSPTSYSTIKKRGLSAGSIFALSCFIVATATAGVIFIQKKQTLPTQKTIVFPGNTVDSTIKKGNSVAYNSHKAKKGKKQFQSKIKNTTAATNPATDNYAKPLVFADDFAANPTDWPLVSDKDGQVKMSAGKISVNGINNDFSYPSTKYFPIDTKENFSVSVTAKWLKGNNDEGFGLDYCYNDKSNSGYSFFITADGFYSVRYFKNNGDWKVLQDWAENPNIHPNNETNLLSIVKNGNEINFYINNTSILTITDSPAFGAHFGIRTVGAQAVEFSNFKVEGLSVSKQSL